MEYNHIEDQVFSMQHVHVTNGMPPTEPMASDQLDVHFKKLEGYLKKQRHFFDDCFANSGDIRFQILTQENFPNNDKHGRHQDFLIAGKGKLGAESNNTYIALRVRSEQNGRWLLIPTAHAWSQIRKTLDFPKTLFDNLVQKGNFQLLTETLNFLLDCKDSQNILLRMISFSEEDIETARSGNDNKVAPFLLRAFLNPKFCRMDNIYLCDAVKKALKTLEEIGNITFSVESDGGDMSINIQFLGEETLTELNEKYMSGIRLTASETGSYSYITVQPMLERLVCLNGMTVGESGKTTRISYYWKNHKMGMDRLPNLPPFPMKDDSAQQREIEDLILEVIQECFNGVNQSLKQFSKRVDRLIKDAEKAEKLDKDDVAAALRYILSRTGISRLGGVVMEDVLICYDEEYNEMKKAINEGEPNIAWVLINAITRYATHYMMIKNLNLAQAIQSRIHSHALNPAYITWGNIWEHVENERKPKSEDHDPVPV